MSRRGFRPRGLVLAAALLTAGAAAAQTHPADLPPLVPAAAFPRCSDRQLAAAGFPDHLHAWTWPGWETPVDEQGRPFGPGAFCRRKELLPREGLQVLPAQKRFGNFVLQHNPGYADCDMVQFLELLDWAGRSVPPLLGLELPDTLTVVNPDNNDQYREATGQGVWRLYALQGDRCVVEPFPILQARTLDGHAAFRLVCEWILAEALPTDLPPWLRQGLAEYVAEDGVHLVNYMNEFRPAGPILYSPPLIDAILGGAPDPDPGRDREHYRRACYSAFLMAWQLVENEGGLAALRDFLQLAAAGTELDDACRRVYGMDLERLTVLLDPVVLGEPLGQAVQSRRPHQQP